MNNSSQLQGDLDSEKKKQEIEKIKLEQEKLKLENIELKRHWLKKPQWLGLLTTTIIAVLSFILFWANGVFDKKLANLELQKTLIASEVKSLSIARDTLERNIKQLSDTLISLDSSIAVSQIEKNDLLKVTRELREGIKKRDVMLGEAYEKINEINFSSQKYLMTLGLNEKYYQQCLEENRLLRDSIQRIYKN